MALAAVAAGFGQFGAVAALAQVARSFGHVTSGATIADRAGLSGSELGLGLAILRLASLGGLPLAGIADRLGRRRTIIWTAAAGLALTVVAAASPSYWWFVALFALGRPFLSATTSVAQVSAAEQTSSTDRARAVALVAAGYAVGAGTLAMVNGAAGSALGFRGLFMLSLIPLSLVWFMARKLEEPGRFVVARSTGIPSLPVIGAVEKRFRGRLAVVLALSLAVGVVTGPANSFVFVYAENVRHLAGLATSAMVAGAGVVGLGGLLAGRFAADRIGRRPTAAVGMVGLALGAALAYSGTVTGLVAGYEIGVFAGATLAPAAGALVNELFPTSVRASVVGWQVAAGVLGATGGLVAFGALADVGNHFAFAGEVTFLPVVLLSVLFVLLPETRGKEPEELWAATA
ncbi:MAG: MFS transporter [Acidimicrobiales bacterium]|nr:MFS transporter [Actinomycetota bacterium]MDA8183990.1 MFS transporter [Actinomycetota bacterium]